MAAELQLAHQCLQLPLDQVTPSPARHAQFNQENHSFSSSWEVTAYI